MTVNDLRCDQCGAALTGPAGLADAPGRRGVRFGYHPGSAALRDDAGLACESCWGELSSWLGAPLGEEQACGHCGGDLDEGRLVVVPAGELAGWALCRAHAVTFLNRLRTVEPKLDPGTFRFPHR